MADDMHSPTIRRALISVTDKTGIVDFARVLHEQSVEIISTGGTGTLLAEANIPVTDVADCTGFPEMMDGRLKTLHPKIHGGILRRSGKDDEVMAEQGIAPIDLVVVNLYPFADTVAQEGCSLELAIENIDIGGPTMIRAAAKNHREVTVVVDPSDYQRVLAEMAENQLGVSAKTRFDLAVRAFEHTAEYDGVIADYLGRQPDIEDGDGYFSRTLNLHLNRSQVLRYGENPHQRAAFYVDRHRQNGTVAAAKQIQGKPLSFNNIADSDAALECVKSFDAPACVIVKHANPCGVAVGADILEAYGRAYTTDPTSAFGGIIAFNRRLDAVTARAIIERQFVEVVIAPEVDSDAVTVLQDKQDIRLLCCGTTDAVSTGLDIRCVSGGLLVQERDTRSVTLEELHTVTERTPTEQQLVDLLFAWKVCKFVKSNAIVYASNCQTTGIGAGQMSRVYSARIAGIKAADENLEVRGSVMASDAFLPFRDGIDAAATAGITAVIQPGGSIRDQEVIDAANESGIAMVFTNVRHFRH